MGRRRVRRGPDLLPLALTPREWSGNRGGAPFADAARVPLHPLGPGPRDARIVAFGQGGFVLDCDVDRRAAAVHGGCWAPLRGRLAGSSGPDGAEVATPRACAGPGDRVREGVALSLERATLVPALFH